MAQATLKQKIAAISDHKHTTELRICRRIEVGTAIHQGDVYVHCVASKHPRGKIRSSGSVQVAVGTGVGSRHIAVGDIIVYEGTQYPNDFTVPDGIEHNQLLGPVIVAKDSWTLTHPEHAHHKLPAGTYQVTYQADMRTRQRVID